MRFNLQDVKKQVQRRNGELYVSLHFLRPGELHHELAALIAYHEQHLALPRRSFSIDDARACIGDYRLAHCLISALGAWYRWQAIAWSEILERIGSKARSRLAEAGITSPASLRLALFDYVNTHYQGFLTTSQRSEALSAFAADYRLHISDIDYLLVLDSQEEEVLIRDPLPRPLPDDVINLYNQWVFEAALCSASQLRFVIDCETFASASLADQQSSAHIHPSPGTGVGNVIKRLSFLARTIGVYYDLTYAPASSNETPLLHLTLYGPQEMTGAPQQYGLRLARLCRQLLGYGRVHARSQTFKRAIVEAEATIHFLQRSYRFAIDKTVLARLPAVAASQEHDSPASALFAASSAEVSSPVFDSSIEQAFAEAFASLENSRAVDGWQLLREPEPLLLKRGIFIPDFALMRGKQRVYVEILGFWTPSYRERKLQKLQQLQDRTDIVLAIPLAARNDFASIEAHFPIAWYDGQLSASELLHILRRHYENFAERMASVDRAAVKRLVESEKLVPERACYALLHCYRRSELPLAAAHITGQEIEFATGVGLYAVDWMEQLRASFVEWIGGAGSAALADVLRESKLRWPRLASCGDTTIEAIISLWPQVRVQRASIFEAAVELAADTPGPAPVASTARPAHPSLPGRKAVHEKRAAPKKRSVKEATQGDLWQ